MTNKTGTGRKPSKKTSGGSKNASRENDEVIRKAKPGMTGGCYVVDNGKVNVKASSNASLSEELENEETA